MAYIDKEKALDILRARQSLHQEEGDDGCADSLWDMCLAIEDLPEADVVEVVRCKDCDVPHNKWTGCPHLNGLIPPPDFYCAKGTQKERGGEK